MIMKNVKLRNRDIKRIYYDAFPQNERMPFWLMIIMAKLWNTQFLAFYDNKEEPPIGLIYFANNAKLVFIMFLAVDKGLRSCGYGCKILEVIAKRYPDKKMIVSIEPCEEKSKDRIIRERRKKFYQQNGYRETG